MGAMLFHLIINALTRLEQPRSVDSSVGWAQIPLPDPSSLYTLKASEKLEIFPLGVGVSDVPRDLADGDDVPLAHFTRSHPLCKDLLQLTDTARFVNFSPSGGDFDAACVELRITSLSIVNSESHLKHVQNVTVHILLQQMHPGNKRFKNFYDGECKNDAAEMVSFKGLVKSFYRPKTS